VSTVLLGVCARSGCERRRAVNQLTGQLHDHCSIDCMRQDEAAEAVSGTADENGIDTVLLFDIQCSPVCRCCFCPLRSMACMRCLCTAMLAQTSDIAELLTDYQIDLLRALEMSRLQFLREIGSLRPGTSDRSVSSSVISLCQVFVCAEYVHADALKNVAGSKLTINNFGKS